MLKELWYLIKLLFSSMTNCLEIVKLKYFPIGTYSAMSWCGKLITRRDYVVKRTKNHENIHLKQALKIVEDKKCKTWLTYYFWYLIFWILGNPLAKPHKAAYYTNPFEMEAFANDDNPDYIVTKDSWKKYKIKNRKQTYIEHQDDWRSYCKTI